MTVTGLRSDARTHTGGLVVETVARWLWTGRITFIHPKYDSGGPEKATVMTRDAARM
jgi:hypothetical protein